MKNAQVRHANEQHINNLKKKKKIISIHTTQTSHNKFISKLKIKVLSFPVFYMHMKYDLINIFLFKKNRTLTYMIMEFTNVP